MPAVLWGSFLLLAALVRGEGYGWSSDGPDLREGK